MKRGGSRIFDLFTFRSCKPWPNQHLKTAITLAMMNGQMLNLYVRSAIDRDRLGYLEWHQIDAPNEICADKLASVRFSSTSFQAALGVPARSWSTESAAGDAKEECRSSRLVPVFLRLSILLVNQSRALTFIASWTSSVTACEQP